METKIESIIYDLLGHQTTVYSNKPLLVDEQKHAVHVTCEHGFYHQIGWTTPSPNGLPNCYGCDGCCKKVSFWLELSKKPSGNVVFSKKSDERETPINLFEHYDEYFQFTLDGAATNENKKGARYLGGGSVIAEDALTYSPHDERVWLNPPYSKIKQFLKWVDTNRADNLFVVLLPSRTDTKWFHDYVWDSKLGWWKPGVTGEFLKGRLKFGGSKHSAPFPSLVVTFRSLDYAKRKI